jgi:hypothetical protein
MLSSHSIRAALAAAVLALPLSATAQQPAPPPQLQEAGVANFSIFFRGVPIGTEQIAVSRTSSGWNIVGTGRLGAPIDAVARRCKCAIRKTGNRSSSRWIAPSAVRRRRSTR